MQAERECEARLKEALEFSDPVLSADAPETPPQVAAMASSPPQQQRQQQEEEEKEKRAIAAHTAHLQVHASRRLHRRLFDRIRAPLYSGRAANLHYRLASLLYKSLMAHHSEVPLIARLVVHFISLHFTVRIRQCFLRVMYSTLLVICLSDNNMYTYNYTPTQKLLLHLFYSTSMFHCSGARANAMRTSRARILITRARFTCTASRQSRRLQPTPPPTRVQMRIRELSLSQYQWPES